MVDQRRPVPVSSSLQPETNVGNTNEFEPLRTTLLRMVWLNVFIVHSSKLFGVTIQNEQSRYQWSCWVYERTSRITSMLAALKWYLEKPLCFQENSLNLQVRPRLILPSFS
ncbi:hypothetical protein TNIN_379271 [Trichonephila inaurata madagascariensis]|uniref:Uncharacterized protein n=1 Tax=Trichonephila inaurata madagascariensis TaxID=2747483 RepID=A0A8X6MC74_9ARAC|nr:hypothetical protein TNIN_379271 [Trichonephila inaurata madagascariensis]